MSVRPPLLVAVLLVLAAAACDDVRIEGPQLADVPNGFGFDPNCTSSRTFLPGQSPRAQRCYVHGPGENSDWITISSFDGARDEAAARAARDEHEKRWARPAGDYVTEYSDLFALDVGGTPGFGFFEVSREPQRPARRTLYALVSRAGTTYAIDYGTRDAALGDERAMKRVVGSFVVRRRGDGRMTSLAVGLVLLLAGGGILWRVRRLAARAPQGAPPVRARVAALGPAAARPAAAPAAGKPVLLDAAARLATVREQLAGAPAVAACELDALREAYAPNAHVLHLAVLAHTRAGAAEQALAIAREALPVWFAGGHFALAADAVRELGAAADALGLGPGQAEALAEELLRTGDVRAAVRLHGLTLRRHPGEPHAIRGLLRIAGRLETDGRGADAATIYNALLPHLAGTPFEAQVKEGLVRVRA